MNQIFHHWSRVETDSTSWNYPVCTSDMLWRQHYVRTSKEYLINCHILLQYFELVVLQLQLVQILRKLIIIWVNYEKRGFLWNTVYIECCVYRHVFFVSSLKLFAFDFPVSCRLVIYECVSCSLLSFIATEWILYFRSSSAVVICHQTVIRRNTTVFRDAFTNFLWHKHIAEMKVYEYVMYTMGCQ